MNLATDGFGNGVKAAERWPVDGFAIGDPIEKVVSFGGVGWFPAEERVGTFSRSVGDDCCQQCD